MKKISAFLNSTREKRQNSKNFGKKAAVAILSVAFFMAVLGSPLLAPKAEAQTYAELEAKINAMLSVFDTFMAQIASLRVGINSGGGGDAVGGGEFPIVPTGFRFNRYLSQGAVGDDVLYLQRILNVNSSTRIVSSGPGSPGNETRFFGSLTENAVARFQEYFRSELLSPFGLFSGYGIVDVSTQNKLNSLIANDYVGFVAGVPLSSPFLTVSVPSQPNATSIRGDGAHVPFTRVTLSAGANSEVTINNFVVEKTGSLPNFTFARVILLDENGNQIGLGGTLGTNGVTVIGQSVTIPAGQSRTFTVTGIPTSNLAGSVGQSGGLRVLSVTVPFGTSVGGTLPVFGTTQTITN
ncbi:MAG: peptidoglycan-binding domain-containing protein [bacterium]|nr:peptidoglycan-binding domain-containing protein [bacterium]